MLTKALSSERSSPAFFAPSNQLTGFGNSIRPMCLDIPYRPASSFSRRLRMPALKAAGVLGVLQGLFDSADLRFHRDFHFSGHDHFLSRGCLFFGFIALVVFVVMRAGPSREQHKDQDQRNHDSIGEIHAAHPFRRSSSATSSRRSQSVFLPSSSSIWRASS